MWILGQTDVSSVRNFLKVYSLKRERDQERLYLKEGSSVNPLRQEIISTENIQQTGDLLGGDRGMIGERAIEKLLVIYHK